MSLVPAFNSHLVDFFEDIQLSNSNQIKMKPIQLKKKQ
jgi:hypothetical protein